MSRTCDRITSKIEACITSVSLSLADLSFVTLPRAIAAALLGFLILSASAQDVTEESQPFRFRGYPNAPELVVVPRKDQLFLYPCGQCHESMESNPEIRPIDVMLHPEIEHGEGRIWCFSCHGFEDRNTLRTLLNEPVDFDQAYLVCGGCHGNRHRDWTFGAHGKRVANWQGERTVYNCTHCHNPHKPAIQPRAPSAAPPVRAGLELKHGVDHEKAPVWENQKDHEQ